MQRPTIATPECSFVSLARVEGVEPSYHCFKGSWLTVSRHPKTGFRLLPTHFRRNPAPVHRSRDLEPVPEPISLGALALGLFGRTGR